MSINDKALELAEAIKSSAEYINLKQAKKAIDSNPGLKRKVDEFKQMQQAIVNSGMPRKDIDIKVGELNKALEDLSKIPEINSYLKFEKELSAIMQKTLKTISSAIDSGLRSR